ncbi:MAG: LysM peptidoglycan-binding domain-containing protein [Sporichthyaceae bacterium]|nr:LysM peptidoglycan-binding domain-containing protein [Sporichthyaceae bacterium]
MNVIDAELSAIAELGLWICLGWLAAGFVVAGLGELPGVFGASCARLAAAISPPLVRRLARCGAGLVLSVAGLVVAPAGPVAAAGGALPTDTATPGTTGRSPGPIGWPDLDRPTVPAPRSPITAEPVPPASDRIEPAPDPAGPFATEVVVEPGDTLWDIAARELGGDPSNAAIAERWPQWHAENRAVIGANPHLILPGQRLAPPG